jgi:LAO/AO transport system kinase
VVDTLLVLHQPESGDDLQAIKKGIIEVSDLFVVTKADGILKTAAEFAAQQLRGAVNDPHAKKDKVFCVSSTEKMGFSLLHDSLVGTLNDQEGISAKRRSQEKALLLSRIANDFKTKITNDPAMLLLLSKYEDNLKKTSIRQASDDFLNTALNIQPSNV